MRFKNNNEAEKTFAWKRERVKYLEVFGLFDDLFDDVRDVSTKAPCAVCTAFLSSYSARQKICHLVSFWKFSHRVHS